MDVKGYRVDVKGYSVDVKGYSVDVKGYGADSLLLRFTDLCNNGGCVLRRGPY